MAVISKSWMNWNSTIFFIVKIQKVSKRSHIRFFLNVITWGTVLCVFEAMITKNSINEWLSMKMNVQHIIKTKYYEKSFDTQANHHSCSYSDFCPFYQFIIPYELSWVRFTYSIVLFWLVPMSDLTIVQNLLNEWLIHTMAQKYYLHWIICPLPRFVQLFFFVYTKNNEILLQHS